MNIKLRAVFILVILGLLAPLAIGVVGAAPTELTLTANSQSTYVSNASAPPGVGVVTVEVTDPDADQDPNAPDTTTVRVRNVTRGREISALTLPETGLSTGKFTGTFEVVAVADEDLLNFKLGGNDGDTIRVIAGTLVKQLTVDGKSPVFANLSPTHMAITRAQTISFTGTVTDARSKIPASGGQPADDSITIWVEVVPNSGTFEDQTKNATFTATSAGDGFNFSLILFLPEGVHKWFVKANDVAGNSGRSDADVATPEDQDHEVDIDATAPVISTFTDTPERTVTTGDAWDSGTGNIKKNVRNSVRVPFVKFNSTEADKLDGGTIQASDFLVGDPGVVPTSVTFVNLAPDASGNNSGFDLRSQVFLTLPTDLSPDSTPVVRLTGAISDVAGNSTAAGSADAADGIAPKLSITITGTASSRPITKEKVTVTVSADEDSVNPGSGSLKVQRVENNNTLGTAKVPSDFSVVTEGRKWEWEYTFTADPGLYNVFLEVRDEVGNTAKVGLDTSPADLTKSGIQLFEVDRDIPTPALTPATTQNPNAFITLDFAGEAKEYGLDESGGFTTTPADVKTDFDTHNTVTLVSASLDGNDITSGVTSISDSSGTKLFYKASGLAIGSHKVTVKVKDEAGNEKEFKDIPFEVQERQPIRLQVIPGVNYISLPGTPDDPSIDSVFPSSVPVTAVLAFDPQDPAGWRIATRTKQADGTFGPFEGRLDKIDGTRAYIVLAEGSQTVSVLVQRFSGGAGRPGELPTPPPFIELVKGWNLVPVIDVTGGKTAIPASSYFAGVLSSIRKVYGFNTGEETFQLVDFTGTITPLETADNDLAVGTAYWVYVDASGVLVP